MSEKPTCGRDEGQRLLFVVRNFRGGYYGALSQGERNVWDSTVLAVDGEAAMEEVIGASEHMEELTYLEERGKLPGSAYPHDHLPEKPGLYVWEGAIAWDNQGTEWVEVCFHGTWRPATAADLASFGMPLAPENEHAAG